MTRRKGEHQAETYTLRHYTMLRAISRGGTWPVVLEAVSSTAMAHPELDWDGTRRTYGEWERQRGVIPWVSV